MKFFVTKLKIFAELVIAIFFVLDSAPCHKAKVIKLFPVEQLDILKWPGNSLDLNPIEELWSYMKLRLQEKDTLSIPLLIDALRDLWIHGIDPEQYRKLSNTTPQHIQAVLKARGDYTKCWSISNNRFFLFLFFPHSFCGYCISLYGSNMRVKPASKVS